ncbi:hypothetical protein NAT51_18980 [Flavobacterium amniphilum]|uniref:hypothetical protein n=1 Tax=Flavobacterium amniphilum TaxID=1834035 RepID=UPI00202AB392|nr:hypothetical protein [Flavobacterium amniphilum]MCL9807614.1 hypothetical protein [Flavobacterium amniphilum]
MKKTIAQLLCMLFFISCGPGKSTAPSSANGKGYHEVIYYNLYNGSPKKSFRVIKNFEDYKAVFLPLNVKKIPKIDFETQNVLVLNVGKNDKALYAVDVEKIIEDSNKLIVLLRKLDFPKEMADKKVNYYPITIVKIKSKKDIILK